MDTAKLLICRYNVQRVVANWGELLYFAAIFYIGTLPEMRKKERITLHLSDGDRDLKEQIKVLTTDENSRFFKRAESFVGIELLKGPLEQEIQALKKPIADKV